MLARVQAAGLTLIADGNRLRWRGPPPAPDLLAELRAHKPEVLALLVVADEHEQPAASPEQAAAEAADRAADPAHRKPADAQHHAAQLAGMLRASLQRPPSWCRPEPHTPPAGAWCGACRGQRWWSDDGRGWCCAACNPPPLALPGQGVRLMEART